MNYDEIELDRNIRLAAFDFLAEQIEREGEVLSFQILAQGFFYKGERICLLGPQGIFKPRILPWPDASVGIAGISGHADHPASKAR
ncbi:MAG: hypothetical protein NTZ26_14815 [Candidatus Aminicenantes bacterium]|nr:hypothetical protein [Candidatus Aminicenantes bacterium]